MNTPLLTLIPLLMALILVESRNGGGVNVSVMFALLSTLPVTLDLLSWSQSEIHKEDILDILPRHIKLGRIVKKCNNDNCDIDRIQA